PGASSSVSRGHDGGARRDLPGSPCDGRREAIHPRQKLGEGRGLKSRGGVEDEPPGEARAVGTAGETAARSACDRGGRRRASAVRTRGAGIPSKIPLALLRKAAGAAWVGYEVPETYKAAPVCCSAWFAPFQGSPWPTVPGTGGRAGY